MSETDNRGRTDITSRALNRVAAAVAADALGISVSEVRIEFADLDGLLGVGVRAPVRIVTLNRVRSSPGIVQRTGGTLIERAAVAQRIIDERVTHLSGRKIAHVTVRLTDANIQDDRRVT
jgi:hypothetical protein